MPRTTDNPAKRTLYDRRYKARHPEKYREITRQANAKPEKKSYLRAIYVKGKQFLLDYLQTHPCVDCGEKDPIVLEFDHVRGEKILNVTAMATAPREKVLAEIAKCDIRCANCHRRRHYNERLATITT